MGYPLHADFRSVTTMAVLRVRATGHAACMQRSITPVHGMVPEPHPAGGSA